MPAPLCGARTNSALEIVETGTKAYAFLMSKKPDPLNRARDNQMKLIALLMYVAHQKQMSLDIATQLFSRLMLPRKE